MTGIAALDRLWPALAAFVAALGLVAASRLPRLWVRNHLLTLGFAASPFLFILPFTLDAEPLHFSERGLVVGLAIFCRGLAIGSLALVLVGTAPIHHTFAAAHRLKVPGLLVLIALLAYRYAFLIGDELRRLRTALRVRGFRPTMNRHGYRTLGHVTGAVLVRGADRAERVSDAMRCRGFDGRFHTLTAFRTTVADVVSCLLTFAATAAILIWDRLVLS